VAGEEVDGKAALARILRHMAAEREEEILGSLDEIQPEVAEEIRDQLITIEAVFRMDEQDIQTVLREFSETEIATLLKGKSEAVRRRVFENISERRAAMVVEEAERLGPMKRSEVAKFTREFLGYIRELEEEGRVVIHREDDYLVE
jgi:flagellar motor switch protein FliG